MKMRYPVVLMAFAYSALLSSPALAQFSQQGPKMVGTGAAGNIGPEQGRSVSLSADGNTAIVGGQGDNFFIGAAWIWTRSGGVWTQQGPKLVGASAVGQATQGRSVSLSADGNTAIVGGDNDNSGVGAAWIWTRSGGVWTQQGTKLVGSGAVGSSEQGFSISLSADGNTAIVGGDRDNNFTGAAWVWTRSGGVWTQQGSKLVGSGAVGNAQQGWSVSISGDGNTAIVGGVNDNNSAGAAWVWTRSGGVWTQEGLKLVGSGAVGQAGQSSSVSLSNDGNTAIIGGVFDNNSVGAAWVWTRSGGVWTQQGSKLVGSDAAGASRQDSVSLSADGNTAIVGGGGDNSSFGAAWIWTRSAGVWTQKGTKLVGSGAVGSSDQGFSASLSADGNTAIIGGPFDNVFLGAAWVFVAPADLSVTKTVTSGPPFAASGTLNYTINVVNNGPSAASGVVVTDVLPAGATFVSATPSQGSCSGTTTVSCAVGALATGGSATITLVLKTSSTPGAISNTATVAASEPDPNPANNSSTSTITTIDPSLIPAASTWALMALVAMLALLGTMRTRG